LKVTAGGIAYEFDPNRFGNKEIMAIEKATGMTAVEWQNGLNRGSMTAATALIWILRRRRGDLGPAGSGLIEFDEVEFDAESLDMTGGEEEVKDSAPEISSAMTPADPSSTPTTTTSSTSSTDGDSDPGSATA
jgi:hypothetical protein